MQIVRVSFSRAGDICAESTLRSGARNRCHRLVQGAGLPVRHQLLGQGPGDLPQLMHIQYVYHLLMQLPHLIHR